MFLSFDYDGSSRTVRVYDTETGEDVENITSINFQMSATNVPELTVTLHPQNVSIIGEATELPTSPDTPTFPTVPLL